MRDAVRLSLQNHLSRFGSRLSCTALIMVYILETNFQCQLNNIRCSQSLAHF